MCAPLFSEVGRDLSRWLAHFVFWLSLCPDKDVSGGRVLWRAACAKPTTAPDQIFRLAEQSLHRSPTTMGDYLRRLKAGLGPTGAITATSRKIATLFYPLVQRQIEFDPLSGGLPMRNACNAGSLSKPAASAFNSPLWKTQCQPSLLEDRSPGGDSSKRVYFWPPTLRLRKNAPTSMSPPPMTPMVPGSGVGCMSSAWKKAKCEVLSWMPYLSCE